MPPKRRRKIIIAKRDQRLAASGPILVQVGQLLHTAGWSLFILDPYLDLQGLSKVGNLVVLLPLEGSLYPLEAGYT